MSRSVRKAINTEDLRRAAKRALPRVIFEFVDDGSDGNVTLHDNVRSFDRIKFRSRAAVATSGRDLRTTVLGAELSMPMLIAPCGGATMVHPDGEVALAKAASSAGTTFVVPHVSGHPMEEVKSCLSGPFWYQLYSHGGADVTEAALRRLEQNRVEALFVTVDTATGGRFEDSLRHGLSALSGGRFWECLPHLPQFLVRPGWVYRNVRGGYRLELPNLVRPDGRVIYYRDLYSGRLSVGNLTWSDIESLGKRFACPIVVKGVLTADDAERAIKAGAAAVVVSNHGGRMLDGAVSSLRALSEVAAAVNGRIEVLFDGGIRRGGDVVKALCLGASAVLIGRASLYGLAAGGEAGAAKVLSMLSADVERVMAFLGCKNVRELNRSHLELPADWPKYGTNLQ